MSHDIRENESDVERQVTSVPKRRGFTRERRFHGRPRCHAAGVRVWIIRLRSLPGHLPLRHRIPRAGGTEGRSPGKIATDSKTA